MTDSLQTISPVDGRVCVERPWATAADIQGALDLAIAAQARWSRISLDDRALLCLRMIDAFVSHREESALEVTHQMGRPASQSGGEISGFEERARYMIDIAPDALAEIRLAGEDGIARFIRREPVGVVLSIAPWNYPYLTAVNSIIPAIMGGNAVILKHSSQTPLCAERMADAFAEADMPDGVFQYLHMVNSDAEALAATEGIDFLCFTGSVSTGEQLEKTVAGRFIGVGFELGGKDPAYVRSDADMDVTAAALVDGSYYNSGQSCCGIERIYVHDEVYDEFIELFVEHAQRLRLGNPLEAETTLGPMVRESAAEFVQQQVTEATEAGARCLLSSADFPTDMPGTAYLAPQALVEVDHSMRLMTEENFGPVVGIMHVGSDDEAIGLMNDSEYGLTASVWTRDAEAALGIGDRVDTGTFFMNRCDYLDPGLAWTGIKKTGRGCTLSRVGYERLTRPKSFHMKTV